MSRWWDRAKKGDSAALEQLVRQYERQIFRVAQHITQNREDAEDIAQDVFLKAYEKLEQFQGNSKFSTWLVRIAVNESLMRLRRRKTSKTVSMTRTCRRRRTGDSAGFRAEWRPNPEQIYGQNELGDISPRKTIQWGFLLASALSLPCGTWRTSRPRRLRRLWA